MHHFLSSRICFIIALGLLFLIKIYWDVFFSFSTFRGLSRIHFFPGNNFLKDDYISLVIFPFLDAWAVTYFSCINYLNQAKPILEHNYPFIYGHNNLNIKAWFILHAPHPQSHKISSLSNLHKFYDHCGPLKS